MQNIIGWSAFSDQTTTLNAALVEVVPYGLQAPTWVITTTKTSLDIQWTAVSNSYTGGSTITSYHVQFDNLSGGNTWTDLVGLNAPFTSTSYSISTGSLVPGWTYKVRYRASNIQGWSAYSPSLSIIAASVPGQPSSVITSISGSNVRVTWIPSSNNGGSVITSYVIRFLQVDGSTFTTSTSCDGSDLVTISNSYCEIPMNTLTASPFSLTLGTTIIVEVSAVNIIGEGTPL